MARRDEAPVELSDYLAVLRHRKWLILLCAILGAGIALVYALFQEKVYTATAKVLVSSASETAVPLTAVSMATEQEIVVSDEVALEAAEVMGEVDDIDVLLDHVEVTSPAESLVLYISYTGRRPSGAQRGAQAFADAYIDYRQLSDQIEAEVIAPASVPSAPSSPKIPLQTGVGGFIGLFVGLIIAFFRDRVDRRVRRLRDVESIFGAPVLAILREPPKTRRKDKTLAAEVPDATDAGSFRTLAAAIARRVQQQDIRTLVVTGIEDEESGALTAANLSVVLAQLGRKVLLVSGNVRRPRIHDLFGMPNEQGLADALMNGRAPDQTIQATHVPGLSILPAGPADPMVMVAEAKRISGFLADLVTSADLVLIDAPALHEYPDGLTLAQLADGIVLVVNAADDAWGALAQAAVDVDAVAARVLGVVLVNSDLNLIEG